MRREEFDWKGGDPHYWTLEVDEAAPLLNQVDDLVEDLVQASFGPRVTVDVGWYPSMDPDGRFRIMVVQDQDWESLAAESSALTMAELRQRIAAAIGIASSLRERLERG